MEGDSIAQMQAFSAIWIPELSSRSWQHKLLSLLDQWPENRSHNSVPIKWHQKYLKLTVHQPQLYLT